MDTPSTKDPMIDGLVSNCFDLIWRIAMAIPGYDIGLRTTRQRVFETPCMTRLFQRDAPQNQRQRRQHFLLDNWCTSLLGPVQGVLCALPSKKAASRAMRDEVMPVDDSVWLELCMARQRITPLFSKLFGNRIETNTEIRQADSVHTIPVNDQQSLGVLRHTIG